MRIDDKNNLYLAADQGTADKINQKFYSKYSYPWYPKEFSYVEDDDLYRKKLCQSIGDWNHERIPKKFKIWVAGCGTNQAVFTALRFPNAEVLGTDISTGSLKVCQNTANQLGITNLTLEEKSLNEPAYEGEFDYIMSTGVIHHNTDPYVTLRAISKGLKKNGVMELMVYNFYHRLLNTAFQKAVRIICRSDEQIDTESELDLTMKLVQDFPMDNILKGYLNSMKLMEESYVADALIQPIEHSYTVDSFNTMVQDSNLEVLQYCLSQFDKLNKAHWNMDLPGEAYSSLPDLDRWQVGNLMMMEHSPMLWFYVQNNDSDYRRLSEAQICQSFLETKFSKNESVRHIHRLVGDVYQKNTNKAAFPLPKRPPHQHAAKVLEAVDPNKTMGEVMDGLGLEKDFKTVNDIRLHLTISEFPYLVSTPQ